MNKMTIVQLALPALLPLSVQAAYICVDDGGKTSAQDRPCHEKKIFATNVPIRARELSDSNSIETVNRFYKAMSERDPLAASRFLADTFTSEVRRHNKPPVSDDKASMTAGLQQVLSAAKLYSAITNCQVINRAAAAYSLSCHVDEQGTVMSRSHRAVSNQAITIVLSDGFIKIVRISAEEQK